MVLVVYKYKHISIYIYMGFIITILAGGEGKRMRSSVPKVLHLFDGKPILVRILEVAIALSPDKIVVVTGKFHRQIQRSLEKYISTVSEILFVEQPEALGTGNAVNVCLPHYTNDDDEVLILNGDMPLLTRNVVDRLVRSRGASGGTIVTSILENPTGYGRIIYKLESQGQRFEIVEEAACTWEEMTVREVNVGMYLFRASVLKKCVPYLPYHPSKREYYFTDVVQMAFEAGLQVFSCQLEEKENYMVRGVNTPEELKELEQLFHTMGSTEPFMESQHVENEM